MHALLEAEESRRLIAPALQRSVTSLPLQQSSGCSRELLAVLQRHPGGSVARLPIFHPAIECCKWLLRQGRPLTRLLQLLQQHPNCFLAGLVALLVLLCGVIVTR